MKKLRRNTELNDFIEGLYVPVKYREEIDLLRKLIASQEYRAIEESDAGKSFPDCLVIDTKGRGLRETYSDFTVSRVDVGDVGSEYANIAIYYKGSDLATPKRISKKNIRINIPCNQRKEQQNGY